MNAMRVGAGAWAAEDPPNTTTAASTLNPTTARLMLPS
jgi:hypothetical protein